jgi:hypothetical protein
LSGWLSNEDDDEDEEAHKRRSRGHSNDGQEGTILEKSQLTLSASEKEAFLPKSPPLSRPTTKETRHWIPSTSRHVFITPQMLNEQQDLDSPYNPNPFGDMDPEKSGAVPETDDLVDALSVLRGSKRLTKMAKFQREILNRGYVPLVLRFISLFFAIIALFLCGFITKFSILGGIQTRPSTAMAFAVNAICLAYLPWVAKVFLFMI